MDGTSIVEDVQELQSLWMTPSCNAVDVTEKKDGGVLKELLKEGAMNDFPLHGDQVTITYDALFADGNRFDSSQFRSDNKFEFVLGKGEILNCCTIFIRDVRRSSATGEGLHNALC